MRRSRRSFTKDGTARIQIVRPEIDPFTYAYLKALGRRNDAEVSVNTSLNVGSPAAAPLLSEFSSPPLPCGTGRPAPA